MKPARHLLLLALAALPAVLAAGPKFPSLWSNVDDRHWVTGDKYKEGDLDSMVVLVAAFRPEDITDKKISFVSLSDAKGYKDDVRFRILLSVRKQRLNEGKLEKLCTKAKIEVPELPMYNQACATNEPELVTFPYYYVVGANGEVIHKCPDLGSAVEASTKAADKLPRDDLYFGQMRPTEKCMGVTNFIAEGKSIRPAYQYLKKIMMGKDQEAAFEAYRLMAAMDQKRDLRIKALAKGSYNAPGVSMFELGKILKMWPEAKGFEQVQKMMEEINAAEDAPKIVKVVADCEKIAAMPVKRKSDAKKFAQQLGMLKKRLEKLGKSKNMSVQAESGMYMIRLDQVLDSMNNWEPEPPPEPAQ